MGLNCKLIFPVQTGEPSWIQNFMKVVLHFHTSTFFFFPEYISHETIILQTKQVAILIISPTFQCEI